MVLLAVTLTWSVQWSRVFKQKNHLRANLGFLGRFFGFGFCLVHILAPAWLRRVSASLAYLIHLVGLMPLRHFGLPES